MITKRIPARDDKRILRLVKRELIPISSNPPDSYRLKDLRARLKIGVTYVTRTSAGVCNGFIHLMRRKEQFWVDMLAIRSAYKRKGLGSKLLRHAERRAIQRDFTSIHLMVDAINKTGIAFYMRNGYHIVRYVKEVDAYQMEKQLQTNKNPLGLSS